MSLTQETIDALGADERDAVLALLARIEALEAASGDGALNEAEIDAMADYNLAFMAKIRSTNSKADRIQMLNDGKAFWDAYTLPSA